MPVLGSTVTECSSSERLLPRLPLSAYRTSVIWSQTLSSGCAAEIIWLFAFLGLVDYVFPGWLQNLPSSVCSLARAGSSQPGPLPLPSGSGSEKGNWKSKGNGKTQREWGGIKAQWYKEFLLHAEWDLCLKVTFWNFCFFSYSMNKVDQMDIQNLSITCNVWFYFVNFFT